MASAAPGGVKLSFKELLKRERQEITQAHSRAQALETEKITKMAQAVVRTQTLSSVVEAETARAVEARKPKSAPKAAPPAAAVAATEHNQPKTKSFLERMFGTRANLVAKAMDDHKDEVPVVVSRYRDDDTAAAAPRAPTPTNAEPESPPTPVNNGVVACVANGEEHQTEEEGDTSPQTKFGYDKRMLASSSEDEFDMEAEFEKDSDSESGSSSSSDEEEKAQKARRKKKITRKRAHSDTEDGEPGEAAGEKNASAKRKRDSDDESDESAEFDLEDAMKDELSALQREADSFIRSMDRRERRESVRERVLRRRPAVGGGKKKKVVVILTSDEEASGSSGSSDEDESDLEMASSADDDDADVEDEDDEESEEENDEESDTEASD